MVEENNDLIMYETLLMLIERKASEKELYDFAVEYGFLSYNHMSLWIQCQDTANEKMNLMEELEAEYEICSAYSDVDYNEKNDLHHAVIETEKEYKEALDRANTIKEISYYKFLMKRLKMKDYSPYGEDLLKTTLHDIYNE